MRILYLLIILAALAGCAIFGDDKEDETADWSAKKLYAEGKESLESEYYTKAAEYYEKLLARHPFGYSTPSIYRGLLASVFDLPWLVECKS